MYEVVKVPLSFTWEIYGDMSAHYNDCFRMFNPLTPQHLQKVRSNVGLSNRLLNYLCLKSANDCSAGCSLPNWQADQQLRLYVTVDEAAAAASAHDLQS